MATKKDKTNLAAAKARKQRIVAIAGGIVLLGLVVIQGPKLWNQLNPPAREDATPAPATAAAVPVTTGATTRAVAASTASSRSTAVLAGVSISAGNTTARHQDGKLLSFSLFKSKDPFVPQVTEGDAAPAPSSGSATSSSTSTPQAGGTSTPTGGSSSGAEAQATTQSTEPATLSFATIELNGRARKVALKRPFPQSDPTFVVVALSEAGAKIGIYGGSLKSGKTVPLQLGEQIALVDSATGTRYTLKLVYVGATPEKTAAFSSTPSSTTTQTTTP